MEENIRKYSVFSKIQGLKFLKKRCILNIQPFGNGTVKIMEEVRVLNIGFLGVGHLASSMLGGLMEKNAVSACDIVLYDRSAQRMTPWQAQGMRCAAHEADLVAQADIVFLMIRPSDFPDALQALRGSFDPQSKLFVSTAAAVSIAYLSDGLGGAPVIRTMPNTALALGMSATALCAGPGVDRERFEYVKRLFESCGICVELPESQMNDVICVSGSSPAYLYYLAQTILDWAQSRGFDPQTALQLVAQTFNGAAKMMLESGNTPAQLRDAVCSPGGTTIEAVEEMRRSGFDDMMKRAMDACFKRAEELAR